mmetsp:Transcript_23639/g.69629  ORF Transcript_23639/g.69629 Transcript_23639/m.69629 type:complete len:209 (+) Transcript_23639:1110-1736(+)
MPPEQDAPRTHAVLARQPVPGAPRVTHHANLRRPAARVAKAAVVHHQRVSPKKGGDGAQVHRALLRCAAFPVAVKEDHHRVLCRRELRIEEIVHVVLPVARRKEVVTREAPHGQCVPRAQVRAVRRIQAHIAGVEEKHAIWPLVVHSPRKVLDPMHAHEHRLRRRTDGEEEHNCVGSEGIEQHERAAHAHEQHLRAPPASVELHHRAC